MIFFEIIDKLEFSNFFIFYNSSAFDRGSKLDFPQTEKLDRIITNLFFNKKKSYSFLFDKIMSSVSKDPIFEATNNTIEGWYHYKVRFDECQKDDILKIFNLLSKIN